MNIFKHNWPAIIYFNFRMLPLKQACHLPFDIYHSVKFINLKGKIIIKSSQIKTGMIKIGAQGSDMFATSSYIIDIKGQLVFNGKCSIGCNGLMRIEKEGTIIIGNNVTIGAKNTIFCEKAIYIGEDTISSWDCQIMDTDTHSILDTKTNNVSIRHKDVKIGKRNWIGNHVIINKGTQTSNETIIASCSLCNKDYTNIEEFSIIGGYPAKLISNNKTRYKDKI